VPLTAVWRYAVRLWCRMRQHFMRDGPPLLLACAAPWSFHLPITVPPALCAIIIMQGKPQPRELPNPLPAATQMYVKMALHTAVHNTRRAQGLGC